MGVGGAAVTRADALEELRESIAASRRELARMERLLADLSAPATEQRYLTVKEAAARLRVSESMVRKLRDGGHISALGSGRAIRIPVTEIERYAAANTTGGAR